MSTKTMGFLLIAAGVIIIVVSLIADRLGVGNSMGFGWKQQLGMAIGVIALIAGAWLGFRKSGKKSQ